MSVTMGDTFLTEPRTMDLPEPEAMVRVREEHARLQGVVFSLNQKISQVLAKQEGDFLAAYRAHMYTVQKELQTLRQRVVEAENVLQKNDKVQKLENECDWYRREALRLDSFNTAMKKDLKYMKERLEILEDDRNWLAKQLKACKKQDKVLRAELELRVEPTEEHAAVPTEQSRRNISGVECSQSQPLLSGVMGSLDRVRRNQHSASSPRLSPYRQPAQDRQGCIRQLPRDDGLTKRIRILERKLVKEQRETVRARAMRSRHAVERAEMEDFFMQCVEDVKRKIEHRKFQARALHDRSAGPRQRPPATMGLPDKVPEGVVKLRDSASPVPETATSKTTLDEFTASDRRAVVESLLQREDVVAHLFDRFFPVALSAKTARPAAVTVE